MKVSRKKLIVEATATGFRPEIFEKLIHLINLLEVLCTHPFLKNRWALKGGTALNLFIFKLPRLSVDIDLNYIGAVGRETMLEEKPKIEQAMQAVFSREGFNVTRQPSEHAGGKWRLSYESVVTQGGNLEVDLNFMLRVPLWPVVIRDSIAVGSFQARNIPVLDVHELTAGKLAALLSRHVSRDLFDAHELLSPQILDPQKLRLGFVLYGAMNRKDWRTVKASDVDFEEKELEAQLVPLLSEEAVARIGNTKRWASKLVADCRKALRLVLPLHANETKFLDQILDAAQIQPSLLTDDPELAKKIETHPSLLWKAANVRKHKGS